MNEMLSQEEIDALLKKTAAQETNVLTPEEKDALGEIGNISMGTSATTLFALLRNKVTITTPRVEIINADQIAEDYPIPFLAVNIRFTEGIEGTNLLLLKEGDARVIADLMMGGDGANPEEMTEITISAVSEAMNQMIGSASTSLSTMLDKPIHISPPETTIVNLGQDYKGMEFFMQNQQFIRVSFKMVVGSLIDSEIMQLLPIEFSKAMVASLIDKETKQQEYSIDEELVEIENELGVIDDNEEGQEGKPIEVASGRQEIKVQPVSLKDFEDTPVSTDKENINLILDVPLNVTVELGRTRKQIREILQFGVGTIVELDKLAGEPVELLVNGKFIAKGEVVVIDESFGVRITDIVHPSKRIDSVSSDN
ncbi:MAG: flagellar motor switch phosphatase FliY [Clostridia bacterium]|nr:flagellar motor switch phosphatase FliY [Clostridiales bacterium]